MENAVNIIRFGLDQVHLIASNVMIISSTLFIEYDASLTGIGVYLRTMPDEQHDTIIGYCSHQFPFELK